MKKLFAVIAGPRLGGKSTLAATLPGKTHFLQAAVLESGSRSAQSLAKKLGNKLIVETFTDLVDLWPKLEAASKSDADHIYIDGYSALNDIRWAQDDIQKLFKNDQWRAFGQHGQEMVSILQKIKKYSYGKQNVFVTVALRVDQKGTGPVDVKLECKGQMAATEITKIGEVVLVVLQVETDEGKKRVLLTRTQDNWPARIDGVLDCDNPNIMEPDLSKVLELINNCA